MSFYVSGLLDPHAPTLTRRYTFLSIAIVGLCPPFAFY